MQFKKIITTLVVFLFLLVSACSKDVPPGDYDASEVGQVKKVVPGVIVSMRAVRLHSKSDDLNPSFPNSQISSYANAGVNKSHGFEYVIKLNSGGIISVVQADNLKFKVKQHVLVIHGPNTRIVPDNGSDDY